MERSTSVDTVTSIFQVFLDGGVFIEGRGKRRSTGVANNVLTHSSLVRDEFTVRALERTGLPVRKAGQREHGTWRCRRESGNIIFEESKRVPSCGCSNLQSPTKLLRQYLNRVTPENKRIHTPPLSPQIKVGVFVVF